MGEEKENMNEEKKLKPVTFRFTPGKGMKHMENVYAQNLLLKALSEGVTDVDELRKLAGLSSATQVYRTLDKIALRKDYHVALEKAGVSLEFIIDGIKQICMTGKDDVRLKGFQVLLKSIGLEKYEEQSDSGKSWEDIILKQVEERKKVDLIEAPQVIDVKYDVKEPEIPEEEKKELDRETKMGKSLYE